MCEQRVTLHSIVDLKNLTRIDMKSEPGEIGRRQGGQAGEWLQAWDKKMVAMGRKGLKFGSCDGEIGRGGYLAEGHLS